MQVLVTGGSGYIAGFLIRALVAKGWTVHTTVRSLSREMEVRNWLGVPKDSLRFFQADLESDAGWAEAMAGCTHVAHVASPFPAGAPKDEELIVPAREGVLRALRFAHAAGVKRLVLTSSVAAIAYGHPGRPRTYTEADWTDVTAPKIGAYVKSKTIAERAARDWMREHGNGMEFVSVNPAAVLGPLLSNDYSTSIQFIERMMDGSVPGIPRLGFGVVDVRDLADLHVLALETPRIDGERFIASGKFVWMREAAAILRERLGPHAKKVPTRGLPDVLVRVIALFDASIRQVTPELGRPREVSPEHTAQVLGWRTRDEAETIVDTARDLLTRGVVQI